MLFVLQAAWFDQFLAQHSDEDIQDMLADDEVKARKDIMKAAGVFAMSELGDE